MRIGYALAFALIAVSLGGCGIIGAILGVGDYGQSTMEQWGVDHDGRRKMLDTTARWKDVTADWSEGIEEEALGKPPSGGAPSWNFLWTSIINTIKRSQQNPEKYIEYIVQTRRARGLPELNFRVQN